MICKVTWSVCAVLAHCCTCVNGSGPRGGHTVSAESGGHTSCLNLCCSARMHAVCICIGCMNASIEWITLHTRRGQEFKCLMRFLRTFWPTENKNEIVNVIKTTMFSGYHNQSSHWLVEITNQHIAYSNQIFFNHQHKSVNTTKSFCSVFAACHMSPCVCLCMSHSWLNLCDEDVTEILHLKTIITCVNCKANWLCLAVVVNKHRDEQTDIAIAYTALFQHRIFKQEALLSQRGRAMLGSITS